MQSMQQNSPPDWTCSICLESFRRAEHFKRHALSHNDERPHACHYCGSQYKRSDALRRHWKSCSGRIASGQDIPKRTLSGKRKQACDSCTSRKRACSLGTPCSECLMRKTECTYHRMRTQEPVKSVDQRVPKGRSVENNQAKETTKPHARFGFLANFTRARGLNEAYSYTPKEPPGSADATFDGMISYEDSWEPNTLSNPFVCYSREIESALWADSNASTTTITETTLDSVQEALLAQKANQIWENLAPILQRTGNLTMTATEWFRFFSAPNLTRYIHLFWARWYQHCPIIHKPTFDLGACSPLLLAPICLIGAFMSSLDSDHQSAKQFLDVVEELIFSDPLFLEFPRLGTKNKNLLQTRQNIQTLQATCFMSLLQKWEGNALAKLRMQRHRFTAFVATTRAMGLSQARHSQINSASKVDVEEWKEYILKAEMIRTFNHVFLLDSAFVIFHNSVPRMVLQEMTIDLTCPEDVFQASSPAEFIAALNSYPQRTAPLLLTDCVRNLCAESPDSDVIAYLHHQSPLNLFTIATAVHGLIFHQLRAFSPLPLATSPLKRALDRWEAAWETSSQAFSKLPGDFHGAFPLHAREFAALARVHIEKSHLSPEEWNILVRKLPENVSLKWREGLATFDQTGMDQVANLILAVEHLDLK